MHMKDEIAKTLKRALAELEARMPETVPGQEDWKRVYEYARRCGFAKGAIKECLELLGERPTNV